MWWMILLIVLAALVGLVLLLAVVGLFLADGHVAERTARYRAAPDAVFDAIREIAAQPGEVPVVVDEAERPRRLVTRISDDTLPFGGRWVYELAADDAAGTTGTRLTIREEGFVKNPIFRALSRTVYSLSSTLEKYHRDLGARFGETVTPAGPPVSHHRRPAA
jgi:hypothetical protein